MLGMYVVQRIWTINFNKNLTDAQKELYEQYLDRLSVLHNTIDDQMLKLLTPNISLEEEKVILTSLLEPCFKTYILLIDYFEFMIAAVKIAKTSSEFIQTMIDCRNNVERNGMGAVV